MSGETHLATLLTQMKPVMLAQEFIFCTTSLPPESWLKLAPLATFIESEGTTLVLTKAAAQQAGFHAELAMRCITLQVHSSLQAVGLTAAVAGALTQENISANVIAGYYHDHIFVPAQDANSALQAIEQLATQHRE
ncbi:MAG: ACT domain-containing protein [Aestuariibacter sp.]